MEQWRQCGRWLIDCKVLPPNHRVVWPSAVVFDLAQALRDGVLLCQLLHNLSPGSVDLKDINFRPQMSQFLCLKNIRTFLKVCHEKFGLRNSELFDPFDLFDVRDFGKVISAVSRLSLHHVAQNKGIRPFPSEETAENDDDVYRSLEELADEHDLGEDIYDCVPCEDEGDDIYEDIIKVEVQQPMVSRCPARTAPQTQQGTLALTLKRLHPQGAASPVQRELWRPFSVKHPKEMGL